MSNHDFTNVWTAQHRYIAYISVHDEMRGALLAYLAINVQVKRTDILLTTVQCLSLRHILGGEHDVGERVGTRTLALVAEGNANLRK